MNTTPYNYTTERIDGVVWEIDYTGEPPTETNVRTAIAEAIANGPLMTGSVIGYHGCVIIDGQHIEAITYNAIGKRRAGR